MKTVRDVVVIGAALGGLTVIAKIASSWPRQLPVSVLIALSTQDQPAETVLQIIEPYAHVGVSFAIHGEAIKPGHIYVSPPNKHLFVGRLGIAILEEPSFFDALRPSVNGLFASAAVVYKPKVIGIVLSGYQWDGVQGMKDIEAAGGVGIVQDPDDATAPQMPRHVIRITAHSTASKRLRSPPWSNDLRLAGPREQCLGAGGRTGQPPCPTCPRQPPTGSVVVSRVGRSRFREPAFDIWGISPMICLEEWNGHYWWLSHGAIKSFIDTLPCQAGQCLKASHQQQVRRGKRYPHCERTGSTRKTDTMANDFSLRFPLFSQSNFSDAIARRLHCPHPSTVC